MSNRNDHITFCDHCGEPSTLDILVIYERLPYDCDSALTGESGCICIKCDRDLTLPLGL
jgi:hypothetical protein